MIKNMHFRKLLILIALVTPAWAGIVEDVRTILAQDNFSAADSYLSSYRTRNGVTPEYIEAYSWMARAALNARDYDQAAAYARQTSALVQEQLKQRPLDAEPHLPLAFGAAIEVQSQSAGGSWPAYSGDRSSANRAAHLWQYFDPRPPAEESEPALLRRKTCARASFREQFLGSKPPRACPTQRLTRAAFLLGALVP